MRWMLVSLLAAAPSAASAQVYYIAPGAPVFHPSAPVLYYTAPPVAQYYVAPAVAPSAPPSYYVPAAAHEMPKAKTQIERYYFLSDADRGNGSTPANSEAFPGRTIIREYYYVAGDDRETKTETEPAAAPDALDELDQLPLKRLEEPQKMPIPTPEEALGDEATPAAPRNSTETQPPAAPAADEDSQSNPAEPDTLRESQPEAPIEPSDDERTDPQPAEADETLASA